MMLPRACILIACTGAPLAAQAPAHPDFVARVDSLANAALKSLPAASIAIAVVHGSDTLLMRGYGTSDLASKRPATANTVYEIGSLTKQFTASAIMRLVEQGKLALDDPISKYVAFPLQGNQVTIRNLLTHTSGIHNYTAKPEWRSHWGDDLSPDSIVGFVARDSFDFAPGTRMRYSNTGYMLLGMIIEKVTGRPYATVLDETIFKPLGLTRTGYCAQHPTDPEVAKGYSAKNGNFEPAAYLSMTHPFAAGAICSTASDLARWEMLFHGGKVVSPASYALMTAPTVLSGGQRSNYGFGLSIVNMDLDKLGSRRALAHSGGINGFLTHQLYLPEDSLEVIVLTNTDAKGPELLSLDVVMAALTLVVRKP